MPLVETVVQCPVHDSFRVQQIAGMFDFPLAEKLTETFRLDVPELLSDAGEQPWAIGLIVGPSGSGKTTLGCALFGDRVYSSGSWPKERAIVDGFEGLSTRQIVRLLTAVGFGSPPAWVKPYHVLSRGEQFRCDLARALSQGRCKQVEGGRDDDRPMVAFDEFTSVVDRTVARIGSAAVARAVRNGDVGCRFVAITCHYDIAQWLEPDWVIDMASRSFTWSRLRRPTIELELYRCARSAWSVFARHHYLSGGLSAAARCFAAVWKQAPVAFCATLPLIGRRKHWRISRLVTLPDFQGIGIGMGVAEAVAELHREEGRRMNVTASHPSLLAHCQASTRWRRVRVMKTGSRRCDRFIRGYRGSTGRAVVSFEFVG